MPHLQLKSLSKCYTGLNGETVQALQGISLEISSEELLAVVGPSASGKTTLLRLIAGLEQADGGQILAAGKDISSQPPRNRSAAMVFQSLALYPHLTAAGNIGFGLRLRNCPKPEIRDRIGRIADRLDIRNCLGRRPFELSAGQRQRVALARALVRQPEILLLDEPFSHLDGPLRRDLCEQLKVVHGEFRLTTVLVTHQIAEANALGHRIVILNKGQLEQVGSMESLRRHPATAFVSEFIESQLI